MKPLTELRRFEKIDSEIIQKQSQIKMIKKIAKKRYMSLEERQKIIDDL